MMIVKRQSPCVCDCYSKEFGEYTEAERGKRGKRHVSVLTTIRNRTIMRKKSDFGLFFAT